MSIGGQKGRPAPDPPESTSMRRFTTLWAGYLLSVLGSSLTSLALGAWVFQQTGSATQYGLVVVMAFLPGIVVTPVAGVLADRWPRGTVLIVGNVLSGLTILGLAELFMADQLKPWHIVTGVAVQSVIRSVTYPT